MAGCPVGGFEGFGDDIGIDEVGFDFRESEGTAVGDVVEDDFDLLVLRVLHPAMVYHGIEGLITVRFLSIPPDP